MRKLLTHLALTLIMFALVVTPIAVAQAAGVERVTISASGVHVVQAADPVPTPEDLATSLRNLAGVGVLAALLGNLGKKYLPQLFPDGSAPAWSLGLNLFGMAVLATLQLTGNAQVIPVIDSQSGALANVLTIILGMAAQLVTSRVTHQQVLAGLPVIGKSNSGQVAGQGMTIIESHTIDDNEID